MQAGIPAGPIYNLDQVFEDPQVRHAGLVETVPHPVLGPLRQLANPLKMDALGGRSVRRPPPLLGEHSREVLREFAYSDDEIGGMIASGFVKSADHGT